MIGTSTTSRDDGDRRNVTTLAVALDGGVVDERAATTTGMIVGGRGSGTGGLLSHEVL